MTDVATKPELDELYRREYAAKRAAEVAAAEQKRTFEALQKSPDYTAYLEADRAVSAARVAHAEAIYQRQEFERQQQAAT